MTAAGILETFCCWNIQARSIYLHVKKRFLENYSNGLQLFLVGESKHAEVSGGGFLQLIHFYAADSERQLKLYSKVYIEILQWF